MENLLCLPDLEFLDIGGGGRLRLQEGGTHGFGMVCVLSRSVRFSSFSPPSMSKLA